LAIDKLTTKEINILILATDMTVFHVTEKSYKEILQEILDWAKRNLA